MKTKIVNSLQDRLDTEIANQNPVKFLKDVDLNECVDLAISAIYLYTRTGRGASKSQVLMTEVVCAIGHSIRNKFKLRRDSAVAAKAGAFVLYTFDLAGVLKVILGKASNGNQTYVIEVLNDELLNELWETVTPEKTEKLPSLTPYAPWTSTRHEAGVLLIKTGNKEVIKKVTPETHPIVFDCVNKAQETGWRINDRVYSVYTWALRNRTDAFAEIWEMQNPEAKASKIREAKAIGNIAKRFAGKTFYHLYTLDFRGRKYPSTAYLHEQGSDLAKGLLLRETSKPIGEQGFYWLLISIASNWAGDAGRSDAYKTDKIPLRDRIAWVLDNEDIILSYADAPKLNQGWMKADKPWQFLAACMELYSLRYWQTVQSQLHPDREVTFDYSSSLECFIDGSNNGSQHLAALTRDEVTAPHVNLVPSELPGDLYKYVGDHVWESIEKQKARLDKSTVAACEALIDNIIDFKKQIAEAPLKSDRRKELIENIIAFKKEKEGLIEKACPVFWSRVTDNKHRRKVVKRNVMTLPYGGTAYGLG